MRGEWPDRGASWTRMEGFLPGAWLALEIF